MSRLVVVADDDEDDIEFFRMAMNIVDREATVISFRDGEEVLDFLRASTSVFPDFIFLDLNMPKYDGIACLSEIKKNARLTDVPVIICSTSNSQKDVMRAMELGASEYITKPTSLKALARLIQIWIEAQ